MEELGTHPRALAPPPLTLTCVEISKVASMVLAQGATTCLRCYAKAHIGYTFIAMSQTNHRTCTLTEMINRRNSGWFLSVSPETSGFHRTNCGTFNE